MHMKVTQKMHQSITFQATSSIVAASKVSRQIR